MAKHQSKKLKNKKFTENAHLFGDISSVDNNSVKTRIELIQYNASHNDKRLVKDNDVVINNLLVPDRISWIKITGLSDSKLISEICKECGIERFDIKNIFSKQRVTKIVEYPRSSFILVSGCHVNGEGDLNSEQLVLILSKNFLITIQESDFPFFSKVEQTLGDSVSQLREKSADYLLCSLMNCIYSGFVETVYELIDQLSLVEDSLISESSHIDIMLQLRIGKANSLALRRIISPMREEFVNLLHNTNGLISAENMMYYNDFDDKLRASMSDLDIYNETLRSLLELYYNNNNQKMNDIIKRLTIISTIFIPLTFMVGVWGMNFEFMPELKWAHGYLFAWGIMVAIAIVAIWWLKKKKWL